MLENLQALVRKTRWKAREVASKGEYVLTNLPALVRFGAACATAGKLDRTTLERLTSRHILKKPLNEVETQYFRHVLDEHQLSDWALPLSFFRLPDRLEMKFLGTLSLHHVHLARVKLVKEVLPPAKRILDIGGAVDLHPEGALLALGYPHRPEEVVIVDLPLEERYHRKDFQLRDMTTPEGTRVSYLYTRMSQLQALEDASFDLVWSGQSIEHVTEAEADLTLAEAFRVLRPGGFLCLDTPNRKVSKIFSRHLLHPDHKIEYEPAPFVEKLERAGFEIVALKGVTPLPIGVRVGRLSKLEILKEANVSEDSERALSFYVQARKPQLEV